LLPVIALIGRPNVGKSTLFNAMTGTRDALVADLPGLTRDRQYGFARRTEVPCIVVDTGGLVENADAIESLMIAQTDRAISEADRLIVIVDGRAGVTPQDQFVAQARASQRQAGVPGGQQDRGVRRRTSPWRIFTRWASASRIRSRPRMTRA
jgi:small GTP-binding protein